MLSKSGAKVISTPSTMRAAKSRGATPRLSATGAFLPSADPTPTKLNTNMTKLVPKRVPNARKKKLGTNSDFRSFVSTPMSAQLAIDLARQKLPTSVVSEAIKFLSLPANDVLGGLRIPVSSYHRKLSGNLPLSSDETERVMRLAEITRIATDAFGDAAGASSWLITTNMALSGKTPLSLLDTDAGSSQVRRVLSVINYGGAL
jgi:putative toxin-antitoxin system antitoxin component (TIGR02293 family)